MVGLIAPGDSPGGPSPPQASSSASSRRASHLVDLHRRVSHRRPHRAGRFTWRTFTVAGLIVGLLAPGESPSGPSPPRVSSSASSPDGPSPPQASSSASSPGGTSPPQVSSSGSSRRPHHRALRVGLIARWTFAAAGLIVGLLAPTSSPGGPAPSRASSSASSRWPQRPGDDVGARRSMMRHAAAKVREEADRR
nr:homeobox protein Nkx-6.1-like [Aegilops tauschii subsp. strangulata]